MLDTDCQPSVFDGVVAVDAGVEHLFRHGGVVPEAVRDLVYGAMFTRGGGDLAHTAIFVGGSDVEAAERICQAVRDTFFGPVRNSVMLDPNGSNTTAAAAVLAASRHVSLRGTMATVLGGTGPVGRRIARLLALEGSRVRIGSRSRERAEDVCASIRGRFPDSHILSQTTANPDEVTAAVRGAEVVIAAGAPGVELLSEEGRKSANSLRVAIDLNAVPPVGLGGIAVHDKAVERDGCVCYGAVGVGGTKMKIHKAAIGRLFASNDAFLDAEEIYEIGRGL
jgi:predicted dinucleotide-binding enzyme